MDSLLSEFCYEFEFGFVVGSDGLKLVCCILVNVLLYLKENGILVCEVGNFMVYMMEQYLYILFMWLEFENGGYGVFLLICEQFIDCVVDFVLYKD